MSNTFSVQVLAEKLSKLNSSQQSIETLSNWCISHRKKAKQVVETWEKLFNSSPKEQRVSFLYLANDILQNSRRKGSEFVNEFWKVLSRALKSVFESADERGKAVVTRLVDIWDERKVFGSRGRVLKDEMLGKESSPLPDNNGKSSQPIKIVKKDAHSIRIKLAVGDTPEKIVTAFQSVHDEYFNEDTVLNKCKAAISSVEIKEKDVDGAHAEGNQQGSPLASELQEHETILRQCSEQLENIVAPREALVSCLKEALQEQESKLELIYSQLQVARAKAEHAKNMKQRLTSSSLGTSIPAPGKTSATLPVDPAAVVELNIPNQASNTPQQQLSNPVTAVTSSLTTAEEQNKKAAAALAAKLAASGASEQIFNSVLSSFVAEEAASKNGSLKAGNFTIPSIFQMEKRHKLEKPMSISDMGSAYLGHTAQQQMPPMSPMPAQAPLASFQPTMSTPQASFPPLPSQPPPPVQHYAQTSGVMVGPVPYGYAGNTLPLPPPVHSHMLMGLARPNTPQPASPLPPPPPQSQQPAVTSGFYQSPGMGFFGQPSTPVPRQ